LVREFLQVAALTLVASAAVGLLVAVGYISDIKIDPTQWAEGQLDVARYQKILIECLKKQSFIFTVLAAGIGEAYANLKPPINEISDVRPIVTVLYLVIAARFFIAAVNRRKAALFSVVNAQRS
jgi:hypothetical protein